MNFKRVLSLLLVVLLVFSSHSFAVLADSVGNKNESTSVEETVETTEESETEESEAYEDTVGASEDSVGASSTSAEEENEESAEEENEESAKEENETEESETESAAGEDAVGTSPEEESEAEESETREDTVGASEDSVGESEVSVGASSTSAEEENEESAKEENETEESETESTVGEDTVGASEDLVGASSTSAEDNIATPSEIEELDEIDFEIEKKDKLLGADDVPSHNSVWCYVGFNGSEMHLARYRQTLVDKGIAAANIFQQRAGYNAGTWVKSGSNTTEPTTAVKNAVTTIYIDDEVIVPNDLSNGINWMLFGTAKNATKVVGSENFNMKYCRNLTGLFRYAKMEEVDLSKWVWPEGEYKANNLTFFFSESSIKKVDFSPLKGRISSGIVLDSMFGACTNLEEADLSVMFDDDVKFMGTNYMFAGCTNLKKVNLVGLDCVTDTTMTTYKCASMFENCTNLEEIITTDKLDLTKRTYSQDTYRQNVFAGCTKLVGGEGTKCSDVVTTTTSSKRNSYRYGKVDKGVTEGTSGQGLFTEFIPVKYNIIYNSSGGSGDMDTQENIPSKKATKLSKNTFTKEHYKFLGWSDEQNATTAKWSDEDETFTYDASEDGEEITLYAIWQKLKYTVTYNSNGGSGTMTGENGESGVELTLKPNGFTRTGYIFRGWDENQNPADPINPQYKPTNLKMNKTITEEDDNKNFVLYAIWTKISYKVVYDGNGATGGSVPDSQTGYSEEELTLSGNTGNLVKTNKKMLGWNEDRNATTATYVFGTEMKMTKTIPEAEDGKEIKLYAIWADLTYTIKLNPNGATGDAVSKTATSGVGLKLDANTFTREHYKFLGWSEDQNVDADTYDVNADENFADGATITKSLTVENYTYNLYAVWKKLKYKVNYNANTGEGMMEPSDGESGSNLALKANGFTKAGWRFRGWDTVNNPTDPTNPKYPVGSMTMNETLSANEDGKTIQLYAIWTRKSYTVKYNGNGATSGDAPADQTGYSDVELTLADNKGGNKGTLVRDGKYLIGFSETSGDTAEYEVGGKMTKTITDAEDEAGKVITLYAVWGNVPYSIVLKSNGGQGSHDPIPAQSDVDVNLPANPFTRENYVFVGWSENQNIDPATFDANAIGNYPATNGKVNRTVDAEHADSTYELFAVWKKITYTIRLNPNGATGDAVSKTATSGEGFKLDANTFTRTHYKFLGWSEDQNIDAGTYDVNADGNFADGATITKSLTAENYTYNLYAVWKKLKYKVNYNANTGEGTMEPSDGESGENLALKANGFTKTGWRFRGWDTVNNPTDPTNPKYPIGNMTMNETLTASEDGKTIQLYAIWTQKKYTVKYNGNGNTSGNAPADQTGYSDVELTLADNKGGNKGTLVRDGKYLIGFSETQGDTAEYEVGGKMTKTITDAEDEAGKVVTLYAVWGNVPYSIVLNSNGGQGSHDPIPAQSDVDANLPANPFTRDNYIFVGWSENQNIDPATFDANATGNYPVSGGVVNRTVLAENANSKYEIFAIWKKMTYTLHYDLQGGSVNETIDDVTNVESGAEITLTSIKPTKGDDTFIGWADAAGKISNPDYAIGGKFRFTATTDGMTKTIYAVYNPKYEYTVTFNPNGGVGSIDSITATSSVDTPLPSNTMTRTGYTFVGWSDNSNDSNAKWTSSINKSVDSDGLTVELFAIWKQQNSNSGKNNNNGGGNGGSGGSGGGGGGSNDGPANPKVGPMGDLTDPLNPNGYNPLNPNGYNPLNPNGYNPLNPNGYNPLNPNGYNPLNPNGQLPRNEDVVKVNNIPKESLIDNDGLLTVLEDNFANSGSSYRNATDIHDNKGYGRWLKTDYTGDWYFYTGDKTATALTGVNKGFLSSGWYKVVWKNEEDWYNFDGSGVMRSGWYNENGKIYYLIADRSNTFFGKMVTGTQVIDGETYQFDNNGVLVGKGR